MVTMRQLILILISKIYVEWYIPRPTILISKIYATWRKRFVFSKSLFCIWSLAYGFVEYRVVSTLIDILQDIWGKDDLRKAAIVTNLQDGLSSLLVTCTHVLAANKGHFQAICFSTASYFTGLMLFWVNLRFAENRFGIFILGILPIALGTAGVPALRAFLEYQLTKIVQSREVKQARPQADISEEEKENDHLVRVNIWWRSARILGALIATISYAGELPPSTIFLIASSAILLSFPFFLGGYFWYTFEDPVGTSLPQIYRVFKESFRKFRLEYPDSHERYYWKDDPPNPHLTYSNRNGRIHLLPRASHLWRCLDKSAIVKEPEPPFPATQTQEINGDLCTVKEVREVKRFASLVHLLLTLLPHSMVMAAGNTFFVAQTSNMRPTLNLSLLFLLKSIVRDIFLYLIWLMKVKSIRITKVRIGVGIVCSVTCCIIAYVMEHHRLSLVKKISKPDDEISMGTEMLLPQFLLLGIMEALVDNGVEQLSDYCVPKSLQDLCEPFSELVWGMGKLLTIPCIFIGHEWFKESMNTSHIDRYYEMLGILNSLFVFIYGYYAMKYKTECLDDEGMTTNEMPATQENGDQSEEIANEIWNSVCSPADEENDLASVTANQS